MTLPIVQTGDTVLRKVAQPLTREDLLSPDIKRLIEAMRETMRAAPGVGLAAPQIGISLQLAVIEDQPHYAEGISQEELRAKARQPVPFHVIVNPTITLSGPMVEFFEGCLSVSGFAAMVPRASAVVVNCWDENGEPKVIEAQGWYARILQHEIDHLNGALYIDRMRSRTFSTVENISKYWKDTSISHAGKSPGTDSSSE